jgi:hypothetical protein
MARRCSEQPRCCGRAGYGRKGGRACKKMYNSVSIRLSSSQSEFTSQQGFFSPQVRQIFHVRHKGPLSLSRLPSAI